MNKIEAICKRIRNTCQNIEKESIPFIRKRQWPGDIDILPAIYLLPIKEPTEEQETLAAALLMIWLSRECHEDVTEDEINNNPEAVLYGDLVYSAAYNIFEGSSEHSILKEIPDVMIKYSQAWFYRRDIADHNAVDKEILDNIIMDDLGMILEMTARRGAEAGKLSPEDKADYIYCAEKLSFLWSQKRYGYNLGDHYETEIKAAAKNPNISEGVCEILAIIKSK
ncbi:MAG: hypothetical protein Q4C00_02250 [Bacillota bacterium]|nr:hypothetical protein [Bacillota bacterium]